MYCTYFYATCSQTSAKSWLQDYGWRLIGKKSLKVPFQFSGRWVAKLVARLLAKAALWVRIQTSLKIQKGRHKQQEWPNTLQPVKKKFVRRLASPCPIPPVRMGILFGYNRGTRGWKKLWRNGTNKVLYIYIMAVFFIQPVGFLCESCYLDEGKNRTRKIRSHDSVR